MKKLTRRDLFRGARTAVVGAAAVAILPKVPAAKPLEPIIPRLPPMTDGWVSCSVNLTRSAYTEMKANSGVLRVWSKEIMPEATKNSYFGTLFK